MNAQQIIQSADPATLRVISYPDPRLKIRCAAVPKVDETVRALVERMFELMFASRGVGLAAPQVGLTVRLFVASPTFDEADRLVFINPEIVDREGTQDGEEGCLSLPGVTCPVKRDQRITVVSQDVDGETYETVLEDLAARIAQHEIDHLDGITLVERMGAVAKLSNRRKLKELEKEFAER